MRGPELSPDGETLVYLARFEKWFDLWKYTPRTKEAKLVAKLGAENASFALDRNGKKTFVLADNRLQSVELESGKVTRIKLSAVLDLDAAPERAYLFEHVWRQTLKKFYVKDMHGVDGAGMKTAYALSPPPRQQPRPRRADLRDAGGAERLAHRRPLPPVA